MIWMLRVERLSVAMIRVTAEFWLTLADLVGDDYPGRHNNELMQRFQNYSTTDAHNLAIRRACPFNTPSVSLDSDPDPDDGGGNGSGGNRIDGANGDGDAGSVRPLRGRGRLGRPPGHGRSGDNDPDYHPRNRNL